MEILAPNPPCEAKFRPNIPSKNVNKLVPIFALKTDPRTVEFFVIFLSIISEIITIHIMNQKNAHFIVLLFIVFFNFRIAHYKLIINVKIHIIRSPKT